jgi:hypothetical protein
MWTTDGTDKAYIKRSTWRAGLEMDKLLVLSNESEQELKGTLDSLRMQGPQPDDPQNEQTEDRAGNRPESHH